MSTDLQLLNEKQTAEALGLSVKTLRSWRLRGVQLPYIKLGKSVRYRVSEIEAYLEANTQAPREVQR